jgi:hypothetical protein
VPHGTSCAILVTDVTVVRVSYPRLWHFSLLHFVLISLCCVSLTVIIVVSWRTGCGASISLWPPRCVTRYYRALDYHILSSVSTPASVNESSRRATPDQGPRFACRGCTRPSHGTDEKARNLSPSCSRSMREWNVRNYDEISSGKQNITATDPQNKRCSIFCDFQVPADVIGILPPFLEDERMPSQLMLMWPGMYNSSPCPPDDAL